MDFFRQLTTAAVLMLGLIFVPALQAHDGPETQVTVELNAVLAKIQAKLATGQPTETVLAPELDELDALLLKHQALQSHDATHVLVAKITLYLSVLNDPVKALKLLQQLKTDFPDSDAAKDVDGLTAALTERAQANSTRQSLVGQPSPPLPVRWSSRKDLTGLDQLHGKTVVLFFWATWSLPSQRAFETIRQLTAHYRGHPVEVIGVTSVQGSVSGLGELPIDTKNNPEKEFALMSDYVRAKQITWPIAFCDEAAFMRGFAIDELPSLAVLGPDGRVSQVGLLPAQPLAALIQLIDAARAESPGKPEQKVTTNGHE